MVKPHTTVSERPNGADLLAEMGQYQISVANTSNGRLLADTVEKLGNFGPPKSDVKFFKVGFGKVKRSFRQN